MKRLDFEFAVLQRSREIPVVVDFWAPWCGPCRVLGPVIERLAAEAAGRWELVKLNTEEQPDIARQYGVSGIPNVKMFHGGEPIAEFVGALPEDEIRRWLDAYLPDERIGVVEAIAARWGAEGGAIIDELETIVREQPDLARAKLRLAQAAVAIDPARARELIASAEVGADDVELAADVAALADLVEYGGETPEKIAPHLEAARNALREHDLDGTLEHLIEIAMRDKSFGDQLARRSAVALFRILGRDHELCDKYERLLSMAINS